MLVRHLLKSSIFISTTLFLNPVFAATIPVAAPTTAFGFNDYQFTANVLLTVPNGINIANNAGDSITANLPTRGSVQFLGNSIITGDIGVAGGNIIESISLLNRKNQTVTFQGRVETDTLGFTGTGLNSLGTIIFEQPVVAINGMLGFRSESVIFKAQTDIGTTILDGDPANLLKINFEGPANFTDNVLITNNVIVSFNDGGTTALGFALNLGGQALINFRDNFVINGDLLFSSAEANVVVFNNKTININNDIVINALGNKVQLGFDLGLTKLAGQFVVANNANITANDKINIINPGLPSYAFGANGPVTLVQSANATILAEPELNAPNNLFISFDLSVDGTNKLLQLTGTRVMPTGLQNNIAGVAEILGSITTANAPNEFIDLGNQLGLYYGTEAQKEALASAAPMNDGAFNQVIGDIQQNTFNLFSKRIEEQFVQVDNYHTGYAAGITDAQGNGSWVKLFGSSIKQGTRDNIKGYGAGIWGIALGVDSKISDTSLLGASFSWATASINHDIGGSNTNINHYQGALYASKNNENAFFVNGMLSLAYNQYDSAHRIAINDFNRTNFAHFHGWQYAARLENGYHYKLKQDLFEIQPIISLNYAHANFNAYQEKGNSLTAQKIEYDSVNTLIADIRVKVLNEIKKQQHKFIREAHVSIGYDVIGDRQKSTAQYIGFGSAYDIDSFSPARTYYNLGLSLTTYGQSNIGVSFGYDYFWKQHYHAHAGFLKIRYDWQ